MVTAFFIAYFAFCGWLLAGLALTWRLSFPLAPTYRDWWDTRRLSARGFKASVFFHALVWPLALVSCKTAKGNLAPGHWCRFVHYPDGHYTQEQSVNYSLMVTHPEWFEVREKQP